MLLVIAAGSALVYAQYHFLELPVVGDSAIWDYMTLIVVNGGMPYRDAVDFKAPLAAYLGAVAVWIGQPLGLREIYAIRLGYLAMAVLLVLVTYFVAEEYVGDQRVAVLAAALMLSFGAFGRWNSMGTEPKTPCILFGLVSLWLIRRGRPFFSGFFGMLAALAWQPGLLFVGVAGLAFSRYLTRWRSWRVGLLLVGSAVPLVSLVLYFWARGALADLYLWAFYFGFAVHVPRGVATGETLFNRLPTAISTQFSEEQLIFVLGAVGLGLFVFRWARAARRDGLQGLLDEAPRHAVMVAPLVYLAFCTVSFQRGRDLIPLLPFVAIYAAALLVSTSDAIAAMIFRQHPNRPAIAQAVGFGVVLVVAIGFSLLAAFFEKKPEETLAQQERELRTEMQRLAPGDTVFTHDAAGFLILTGQRNSSKYYVLHRSLDGFLEVVEPNGFLGWFDDQRARRPKLLVFGPSQYSYTEEVDAWIKGDYDQHRGRFFRYYVRKDAA